jgi:hypothetical protein
MIIAVMVPVPAPTAIPCTIRAAIRPPEPPATVKSSVPSARSIKAPEATGRRPTRSESEPMVSNAASRAMAYAAKMSVSVNEEKPHRR